MAFRRLRGRTKVIKLRKADNVAITNGELVKSDTGRVTPCISSTTEAILGVALDSYASDTTGELVSVEVPTEMWVEWEFDIDASGGLVASDVLEFRDLDTLGANVDRATATDKVIFITRRVSATKGIGVLAKTVLNTASNAALGISDTG